MTDEKILKKLTDYYEEALPSSKVRRKKWKKLDQYWKNKQKSPNYKYFNTHVKANYCRVVTDVKMPVLVGNKPTITYISRSKSGDQEKNAEILSKIVGRYVWDKCSVQTELKETLYDSMICDIGYMKTYFDADINAPYGETVIKSVDPFKLVTDPYITDIDEARYVGYVDKQPISVLNKRFPGLEKKITKGEDQDTTDLIYEERKFDQDNIEKSAELDRAEIKEWWIAGSEWTDEEAAQIVKSYINKHKKKNLDRLLAEIELTPTQIEQYNVDETELFEYMTDVLVERVKHGGIYATVINDEIIAELKPNPYKHGKSPYVSFISNMVPHSLYGRGDLEDVISLQDTLNEALSQIHDSAIKTSSPTWRADPLIGKENIRKVENQMNKPGTVVLVKPGMLEPNVPPQIPAYAVRRIPETVSMIERVSGATDVLQGRGDIRQRTALGVQVLTQAGTSRISTSISFLEQSLKKLAYKAGSIVQQFWTDERTIAIAGDVNYKSEVITVSPGDIEGEFEVSVDSGATLPQDKMSKIEMVMNVYKMGIIQDSLLHLQNPVLIKKKAAEYVLNLIELPHRDELMKQKPEVPGTPPGMGFPNAGAGPSGQSPATMPQQGLVRGAQQGMSQQPIPQGAPQGMPQGQNLPPEAAAIMDAMEQAGITPEEVSGLIQAARGL